MKLTLLLLLMTLLCFCFPKPIYAQSISHFIYDEQMRNSWVSDISWGDITANILNTNPVSTGTYSIAVTPTRGWTAWHLKNSGGIDNSPYAYLTFAARANTANTWWEIQFLDQNLSNLSSNTYKFSPTTTGWVTHQIDLNTYGVAYSRIYAIRFWYVTTDIPTSTLYVDQIGFGGVMPPPPITPTPAPINYTFSVNADQPINPFSHHLLGVALANWEHSWNKYFPGEVPGLGDIYRSAGVGLIRYAGGLWANWVGWDRVPQRTPYTEWTKNGNTYSFHYGTDEIDSLAVLSQQSGADVMVQVNLSMNDPDMWADMVRYTNSEHNYNFKYWELGNELDLECYKGAASCLDAATYQSRAAAYKAAMKAVDPSIIIVGGVPSTAHDVVANNWVNTQNISRYLVAAKNAGADAYSYHWYTDCNLKNYDNIFTWSWAQSPTDWRNMYSRSWSQIIPTWVQNDIINPTGLESEQGITELNIDACDFNRAPINSNHLNALWFSDVLGRLAYNGLDFITWYEGYGNGSQGYPAVFVEQDNPPTVSSIYLRPPFYTTFMYGNFFGDQIVTSSNPSPDKISLYAAYETADRSKLKLIVTNLSPNLAISTINIFGFTPSSGVKYELTNPNPLDKGALSNSPDHGSTINGYTLLSTNISVAKNQIPTRSVTVQNGTVTTTFLPYSVTAVVLNGGYPTPTPTSVDIDHDGDLDFLDISALLRNFGSVYSIFHFNRLTQML